MKSGVAGAQGRTERRSRPAITVGLCLGVVMVLVCVKVGSEGSMALERGGLALASGDERVAALHWREAMGWYLPGGDWREEAADQLWRLHEVQSARGDVEGALASLWHLEAGLSVGSEVNSEVVDRGRLGSALSELTVLWGEQRGSAEGRRVALEAGPVDGYKRAQRGERWGGGVLAAVGFFLWIGLGLWGLGREEGLKRVFLCAWAGALLCFLVGVWQA